MSEAISSQGQMPNLMREFVFIVCYRFKLVAFISLVVFGIAVIAAVFLPSQYKASAKYYVTQPTSLDPLSKRTDYDAKYSYAQLLQNQKAIVYSNRMLRQVCNELHHDKDDAKELQDCMSGMADNISVSPPKGENIEGSSVFYVSYQDKSAFKAYEVMKVISDAYLNSSGSIARMQSSNSYKFFEGQVKHLFDEMNKKAKAVRSYETANAAELVDILNLEPGKTNIEVGPKALLTESLREKGKLESDLASLQVLIVDLENSAKDNLIPVLLPEMEVTGRAVTVYKNKIAQLQLQLNEMKTQFTSNFEPMKQLEQELAMSIQLLRSELALYIKARKIDAAALRSRLRKLEKNISILNNKVKNTAKKKSQYDSLRQEYELAKESYTDVKSQMEQADMAQSLSYKNQYITLVDAPVQPIEPFKPNRPLIVLVGLFAGLFLGLSVVLVLDFMDHSLKTPEDIERYIGVGFLGSVPHVD